MSEQEDIHYYQNQPYDLEVDINHEDEEAGEAGAQAEKQGDLNDAAEEQNYQEVVATPPVVKALPKFDLSKFDDLGPSEEARDLLAIMKK